ncbi:MAG: helix-hairpin-helix domain-containing protein [Hydrotalea sp.]|nr:helix-hairpin-helix domain-containing protein [Hydrotalea sp.]
MSSNWKEYLTFSRKERVIAIAAGLLLIFLISFPYWYHPKELLLQPDIAWEKEVDGVLKMGEEAKEAEGKSLEIKVAAKKFYFDPNSIGVHDWMALGVSEKTANTILNYRNKGGRFRKPDDLFKIWGMDPVLAKELIPFVRLAGASQERSNAHSNKLGGNVTLNIDINKATQEEWKSLPGIGEVISGRIIKFRERLGGFAKIEQVAETYGLADSVFQKIRPKLKLSSISVQKISVLQAEEEVLSAHPYISRSLARAWVQARAGWIAPVGPEQLLQLRGMDQVLLDKLMPYLSWE